jgi:hypothetical protein
MASNTSSEFIDFLVNPAAHKRGGGAVQAVRGQQRRGLMERMAQAEVNHHLRDEVDRRAASDKPRRR